MVVQHQVAGHQGAPVDRPEGTVEPIQWPPTNQTGAATTGCCQFQNGRPALPRGRLAGPQTCFTTPSPDSQGRASPAKNRLRTSEAARQRWLADNRQFAPRHDNDHAMAWMGEEAVVIPPDVKEQLHNFPRGFTKVEGVSHRSRHRMMANSWHLSSASVMLAFMLQWAYGQGTQVPVPVHESAIQKVIQFGNCNMARPGPCFSQS